MLIIKGLCIIYVYPDVSTMFDKCNSTEFQFSNKYYVILKNVKALKWRFYANLKDFFSEIIIDRQ